MNKTFLAIVGIIVVVFGGILLLKEDKPATEATSNAKPTSNVIGKGTASVTLVEYGDFQCPYCGGFFPVVKEVKGKYGDQITFQFRHLPIQRAHINAFAAARAAEAAALQNKFWEMHDLLFINQNSWAAEGNPNTLFEEYARQLGLDVATFKKDAASSAVNDRITADMAEFNKTGNEVSTPTFFLNGKKIAPQMNLESFTKLIDAEINKQKDRN